MATARRAARYVSDVVLIEKTTRLGGTCVNVGCVPKKVMFNAATISEHLQDAKGYCFDYENLVFEYPRLKAKRDAYVKRLNGIYEANLERDRVIHVQGAAKFVDTNTVDVNGQRFSAPHIIIATGGRPTIPLEVPGHEFGIDSDYFFDHMENLPKKVAIVGSGYIAVELACVLSILGSDTHIYCRRERFLRKFDSEVVNLVRAEMESRGCRVHPNVVISSVVRGNDGLLVLHGESGQVIGEGFDQLIWAIGRGPNTSDLDLDRAGVSMLPEGFIKTDEWQNTTTKGIYAVGDVCGPVELTPVAIAAGRALAERLFNGQTKSKMDYDLIPTVIFSHPPIGTCGLSEEEAVNLYGRDSVKIAKSTFTNMFYSMTERKEKTLMKMEAVVSTQSTGVKDLIS
eukprot:TRINITY_DN424_c0_g1_i1.p1 TRINITY_DN424_c0_g1~~TRINITY_DN424_c0_g1_i1.p1  ORF type:complete len:431 (+),score=90.42 TRINITY_DN424_c0_g1_i1:101-1294(+)